MPEFVQILFIILFIYLASVAAYLLAMAIGGRLYKSPAYNSNASKKRIAVLIPAYKEDNVIVHTATEAINHDYPQDSFDVFIAADQLQPATIARLSALRVRVVEVDFPVGSKARSLNALLNYIRPGRYDVALVLDADNIMLPGCMEKINAAFQQGFRAVQVHRTAKNLDSNVAILDAVSEEINNHLFRKAQRSFGFSSTTIGSGMAFEFSNLKEIYDDPSILDNPACDREVDFEMMRSNICIEYISVAYVLDEKVAARHVFEKQRTRWLESQLMHLGLFFSGKRKVETKTKDYWNKLLTNLLPPRLMLVSIFLLVFLLFVLQTLINYQFIKPAFEWWLLLLIMIIASFLLSVPSYLYNAKTLKSLLYLPVIAFSLLKALFHIKPSRKEFVHTPKSYVDKSSYSRD
jgi:cellulose synthase/poly-beta-1,6-N-acetylglucosamine synthase-like glycosyltransferase